MRWLTFVVAMMAGAGVLAADWPEWRGAGRRGVWDEQGIVERFPADGLRVAWRVPIAEGYAGPAVADGRVFVTDFVRTRGLQGTERARCHDETTGKLIWQHEWPVDYSGTEPTWANGPRATPTVDGERVYVVGAMGRLIALGTTDGEVLWQRDLVAEDGAAVPTWGVASAPIVHEGLLIALIGGEQSAVVAFDKLAGEPRWRALKPVGDPGYVPPILIDAGGQRQLVVWHPAGLAALAPSTGQVYWEQPLAASMALTVATPVFDRGRLLVSAFFDGALMLRLADERPAASVVWRKKGATEQPGDTQGLHALITTPVIDGDQVYGIGSYGEMRGLDAATGRRLWESGKAVGERARWAAALIVRNGDRYFINNDRGELIIARLAPDGYHEVDRTKLIEPTTKGGGRRALGAVHWSHPAYANRHIVVRNDRELVRASLIAPVAPAPSKRGGTSSLSRVPRTQFAE